MHQLFFVRSFFVFVVNSFLLFTTSTGPSTAGTLIKMADDDLSTPLEKFRNELDRLRSNNEVRINLLKALAEDYNSIAADIVRLIDRQIFDSESQRKLWLLYVMDSICKDPQGDHREEYRNLFQTNLCNVFCHTFEHGIKNIRGSRESEEFRIRLYKLRFTWNATFSEDVLHQIDVRIKQMDPNWPILSKKSSDSVANSPGGSSSPGTPSTARPHASDLSASLDKKLLHESTHQIHSNLTTTTSSSANAAATTATANNHQPVHINPKFLADRNPQLLPNRLENDLRAQIYQKSQELALIEKQKRRLEQLQRNNKEAQRSSASLTATNSQQHNQHNNHHRKTTEQLCDSDQGPPKVAFKKRLRHDRAPSPCEPSSKRRSPNNQWANVKRPSSGSPNMMIETTTASTTMTTNITPPSIMTAITTMIGSITSQTPAITTNGSSLVSSVHLNPAHVPPSLLTAPTLTTHNNSPPQHSSTSSQSSFPSLFNRSQPLSTLPMVNGHNNGSALPSQHSLPSSAHHIHHPHHHHQQQQPPSHHHSLAHLPHPPSIISSAPIHPPAGALMPSLNSHATRYPPPPIDSSLRPTIDQYRPDIDYRTPFNSWRQPVDQQLNGPGPQEHLMNEINDQAMQPNGRPYYGPAGAHTLSSHAPTSSVNMSHSSEELTVSVDKETKKLFYLDQQTAIVLMKPHVSDHFERLRLQNPIDLDVRQIRFEGQPTNVWIDDSICILLAFDGLWKSFKYNDCEQRIKFGGPGKEVFLNNQTIQAQFGGSPVACHLDGDRLQHMIRLDPPSPRVKLSEQPRPDLWRRLVELYSGGSHHILPHPSHVQQHGSHPPPVSATGGHLLNSMHPTAGLLANSTLSSSSDLAFAPANQAATAPVNVNDLFSKLVAANLLPGKPEAGKSGALEGATAALRNKSGFADVQSPVCSPNMAEDSKSNKFVGPRRSINHQINLRRIHPPLLFQPDSLKQRRPQLIEMLYRGTQCTNCSLRFDVSSRDGNTERYLKAKSKYAQHLDWHFRQNRKIRAKPTSASASLKRPWYYSTNLWLQFREITEEEEENMSGSALANFGPNSTFGNGDRRSATEVNNKPLPLIRAFSDESRNTCSICYERFEQIWCEDEEEWKLENAVQSEDGEKCYHPLCLNDLTTTSIEMAEEEETEKEDEQQVKPDIEMSEPVEPSKESPTDPLANANKVEVKDDENDQTNKKATGNLNSSTDNASDETQQSDEKKEEESVKIKCELDLPMDENATFELTNKEEDVEMSDDNTTKNATSPIASPPTQALDDAVSQPLLSESTVVKESAATETKSSQEQQDKPAEVVVAAKSPTPPPTPPPAPTPSDTIQVEIIGLDLPFVTSHDGLTTISSPFNPTVGEGSNGSSSGQENGFSTEKIECPSSKRQQNSNGKPILLKLSFKESNLNIVSRNQPKPALDASNEPELATNSRQMDQSKEKTAKSESQSTNQDQTHLQQQVTGAGDEVVFCGREESALCNIM